MAYKKQTWVDLETPLDAEHMNHIEDGIGSLSEEMLKVKDAIDYQESAEDITLVNGIGENGNFGDDSVWVGARCTPVVSNNECVFTGTAYDAYILSGGWGTKFDLTAGHKIYMFASIKADITLTLAIRMGTYSSSFLGRGEYAPFSVIHTVTADTSASFQIAEISSINNYTDEVRVKKAGFIDLTACFGEGNEPTLYQMDAILAAFDNFVLNTTYNPSDYRLLPNLIGIRGNFITEDSWYAVRANKEISNNECTFISTEQHGLIRPAPDTERVNLIPGHIMYYHALVKSNSDRLTLSFNTFYPVQFKGTGRYEFISGWAEITDEKQYPIQITNVSPSLYAEPVSVKKVGAIDLTEVYGAGNEPTKTYMDALIAKYGLWFNTAFEKRGTKTDFTADFEELQTNYTASGVTVLYLNGSMSGMSKENAVPLSYAVRDKTGTCEVKWQGSSSIAYPKKNFTIKFENAFEAKEGWGAQKKYCFKANYIDPSALRNIGSSRSWGEIVKSRANVPTELSSLPNGGAIDGFPCVIVFNGEFYGLYTWNIPKDGWMFGSPKAIVSAGAFVDATGFKALATFDGDFKIEYAEDENDTSWILPSFNAAIQATIDSDGSDLDTTVGQYIDIPSVIDYIHHVADENAGDCVQNNALYVTFDYVKWYMSSYDRDSIMGSNAWGEIVNSPIGGYDYAQIGVRHRLMQLIMEHKTADFKARGIELREGVKSEANVSLVLTKLASEFPLTVFADDARRWPTMPSTNTAGLWQMLNWYRLRRAYLDPLLDAMG